MIDKIKRDIYKKLSESSFDKLEKLINNIFYNNRQIIFSKDDYNEINSDYLKSIIEDKSISIFLETIDLKYSKKIQENAFVLGYLEKYKKRDAIQDILRSDYECFSFLKNKSSSTFSKINNCLKNNLIYLSFDEKELIFDEIFTVIDQYLLNELESEIISYYIEFIFYMLIKYKEIPNPEIIQSIISTTLYNGHSENHLDDYISVDKEIKFTKVFDLFYRIRKDFSKPYQWIFDVYLEKSINKTSELLSNKLNTLNRIGEFKNADKLTSYIEELLTYTPSELKDHNFSLSYKDKIFDFDFISMEEEYFKLVQTFK